MRAVGFNTLEAAEDLRAAGLNEAHAKAIVATVHRTMTEGMATKKHVSAEVAGAEGRLRAELAATRGELHHRARCAGRLVDARICTLRAGMLKTAIGIVVTNVTVTVALLKLIP